MVVFEPFLLTREAFRCFIAPSKRFKCSIDGIAIGYVTAIAIVGGVSDPICEVTAR